MPGIRAWGGKLSPEFQRDLVESVRQEQAAVLAGESGRISEYTALALSGGGSDGAFGAGFLNGWSIAGTRPDFKLVTGISTGALIAPFAFLGSNYDDELKEVFTTTSTKDILRFNNIFKILFRSEAFASAEPLENVIAQHIDQELLQAVADRHDRGYRLYIGTTNMDAQRLSIWNMGLIATYGTAEALDLFRKIMVASASIPAAFPPVMIEVELNGRRYDEMHTDGGTVTQVFFNAGIIDLQSAAKSALGDLYVIRNGQLSPEAGQIERKLPEITDRAITTMIKMAAMNNLYRIYAFTGRDNVNFHYVDIPDSYVSQSEEVFDRAEMNRLFEIGYQLGLSGDAWQSEPPGLQLPEAQL
jgi:predicted patatin/cPLA2 family phospholipase